MGLGHWPVRRPESRPGWGQWWTGFEKLGAVCCESSARDASTLGHRVIMVAAAAHRDEDHIATRHTIYRTLRRCALNDRGAQPHRHRPTR